MNCCLNFTPSTSNFFVFYLCGSVSGSIFEKYKSGSTKMLNADQNWIRIHNTGAGCLVPSLILSGTLFVTNKPWWFLKLFETNVGCREQKKTKAADCLKPKNCKCTNVLSPFFLKSWMGCHMSGTVMVILSLNSSYWAKREYREREKKIIWIFFFCFVYCSCLYLICCGFPVLLKEPRPDPNHRRHFRFIVPRGGRCAVSLPLATESRAGWSPHPRANRQPTVPGGRTSQPSACRTSPRQHEHTADL